MVRSNQLPGAVLFLAVAWTALGCTKALVPSAPDAGPTCSSTAECALGTLCDVTTNRCYQPCTPTSTAADAGAALDAGADGDAGAVADAGAGPDADAGADAGTTVACPSDQVCSPTTLRCLARCTANSCAATPSTPECNSSSGLCEACVDDSYSPNHALSAARSVSFGNYKNLRICSGRDDWFAIDLGLRDRLRVEALFRREDGNLDIELWDTTKTLILATGAETTDNESISAIVPVAGTYYFRVKATEQKNTPYELVITVTPAAQAAGACTPDSFETNNAPAQAKPVNRQSYTGLTLCAADEDWYSLALSAGEKLRLDLLFPVVEGNLDVQILQSDGVTVLATGAATGDNETIIYTAPTTASYLIRVYRTGSEVSNSYAMVIQVTPPCGDDAYEPNGVSLQAATLTPGNYPNLKICPLNEDWYKVALNKEDLLVAEAIFAVAAGNLNMQIIDRDGVTALATGASTADNERVSVRVGYAGTYYIRVYGVPNTVATTYELRLAVYAGCTADSNEPNGLPSVATNMATLPYTATNQSICPGDEDWFKVQLDAGDRIVATAAFTNSLGNIEMQLIAPDSATVIAGSYSANDDEIIAYTVTQTGTYYLRLYGYSTQVWNTYSLTVDKTAACANDSLDNASPNNDYFQATATGPASYANLVICPGDEDWFAIALTAGQQLIVSAAFTYALGDLNLQVYNSTGVTAVATAAATNDNEVLSYVAPATGTYYIRVYGAGILVTNTYNLTIATVAPCTNDANDNASPNQSYFQATTITAGTYNSLKVCPADVDFYKFTLAAGEKATVAVTFTNSLGNIDTQVYGTDGVTLLATSASTTADYETIVYTAPVTGTYYARVYGATGTIDNSYSLTLTIQAACANDSFEPNQYWTTATAIDAGTYTARVICAGDTDYYRIALDAGERLTAALSFTNSLGNLDLQCLDKDGTTVLATSASGTTDYEQISYTVATGGNYFLRVYGANAAVTNTYQLDVSVTPPCANDSYDNASANNSYLSASGPLGAATYNGLRVCPSDVDYYKVTLATGDRLTATATFTNSLGNIDMQLYGADGVTWLAGSGTTNDYETIIYAAPTAGTYYLRLYGANASVDNSYSLSIAIQSCANDPYDTDGGPNSNYTSASLVAAGSYAGLRVCPTDNDYYKIPLNAGEKLTAAITFSNAAGDLALQFVSTDGVTVLATSSTTNDYEQTVYTVPSSGTYFVRVYGANTTVANTYQLDLFVTPACVNDAFDIASPNNSYIAASGPLDAGTYAGLRICPADVDYYKVALGTGERLTATATFTNSAGNIDVQLYGTDGVTAVATSAGTTTDYEIITYTAMTPGNYFLRLYGANASVDNAYSLTLGVQSCSNDTNEPNNNSGAATTITPALYTGLMICPSDEDWYKVSLSATQRIVATILFTQALGDMNLYLYATDGATLLATAGNVGPNQKTLGYNIVSTGDYYLRAVGVNGSVANSYSLNVTTTATCAADSLEPNPYYTQATDLMDAGLVQDNTPVSWNGLTLCPGDEDWYRVNVVTDGGARIQPTITFTNATGNLNLQIYRPDGVTAWATSATTNDTETLNQLVTRSTYGDGTYFLRVYGATTTDTNTYNLTVNLVP